MQKNITIRLSIIALITLSACAQVFYSPDSQQLASKHRTIAIMPPTVSYTKTKRNQTEAELLTQTQNESNNLQTEIYNWMLRRHGRAQMRQDIQALSTTNAKLKAIKFPDSALTASQICAALKVDALIYSNFKLTKPISDGAAVALILLANTSVATNTVTMNLNITDGPKDKVIFNYNHTHSAGVGSTVSSVVNALMRNASKKMPYFKRLGHDTAQWKIKNSKHYN